MNGLLIFTSFGFTLETWFIIGLLIAGVADMAYKFHAERDYRSCSRQLAALHAAREARRFNQISCPICLEEFDTNNNQNERQTAILICGHKFCKDCLDSWFQNVRSNRKCPICRHDSTDWSAATDEQRGDIEEKKQDDNDDHGDDREDDIKRDDTDDRFRPSSFGGYDKTSTSDDSFYEMRNEQNMRNDNNNNNESGMFRRRHRGYNRYGCNDWMFQQELLFRMRRIRYLYPRYLLPYIGCKANHDSCRKQRNGDYQSFLAFSHKNFRKTLVKVHVISL